MVTFSPTFGEVVETMDGSFLVCECSSKENRTSSIIDGWDTQTLTTI